VTAKTPNQRVAEADIDAMFTDRWSPRGFFPDPLPEHQILALFEAARWAPSCFNEQPWFFIYATDEKGRRRLGSALVAKNQRWALSAPLLMFVLARRRFKEGGRENRHAPFDAGSAWMSLALQARKMGLYAHAMAGFNLDKAYKVLGVPPDEYLVMAAIAVGRRDPEAALAEDLARIESPNSRKPLTEVATDRFPPA
jgi:nitroreductase